MQLFFNCHYNNNVNFNCSSDQNPANSDTDWLEGLEQRPAEPQPRQTKTNCSGIIVIGLRQRSVSLSVATMYDI